MFLCVSVVNLTTSKDSPQRHRERGGCTEKTEIRKPSVGYIFCAYCLLPTANCLLPMTKRTRTITWDDPLALAKAGAGLSGLEYLNKIVAGELPPPPIGLLMDFRAHFAG